MKVIYGIGKVNKNLQQAVLTIGVFDGVHLGHKKLIQQSVKRARSIKAKTVVMTFYPSPYQVLRPKTALPLLTSLSYRLKLLEKLDVDACIVIRFTKKFAKNTPESFIKQYLLKYLKPREISIGDDFRFGKDRDGSLDYFKKAGQKYNFRVNHILLLNNSRNKKIGSTLIRKLIVEGKLNQAKRLLGRNVSIMGKVIKGEGRGISLGYPTVNLIPANEIYPPLGVYIANIIVGNKSYQGMANIGCSPSFNGHNSPINIEAHIFDFNKSLYGKEIIIEFIQKIRNEIKFPSKEKLIAQLKKDEKRAKLRNSRILQKSL